MSGDRRKRKQALEKIIHALVRKREEFRKEKKTGAGSATEAIEFYQFVLDKNLLWKAKAGKKSKTPMKEDNAAGQGESSNAAGANEEDFFAEHNDICEVCGIGGELLCCNTCNLVFHLKCVRPVLKAMPPDSWSCAHCDATGVTGLKKENRQRKRAITAIREMKALTAIAKNDDGEGGSKSDADADGDTGVKKEDVKGEDATSTTVGEQSYAASDDDRDQVEKDNDGKRCRVCSHGGDLITCSQSVCGNSFHVSCIRPVLETKPGSDWNCAFCDVDFVTGLKPQARKRRAAISGVRAMEKLKIEFENNPSSINRIVGVTIRGTPQKRKLDEMNEATPTHPGQPRSQRIRRQIIEKGKDSLDDIDDSNEAESTPAPSVEKPVLATAPPFTRDEIPSELIKKLSRKVMNSNSRHGQYNCKFCMDDESAETCCFCACRICFTKHSSHGSTILCDLCDGEYHTYCLSPPLAEIPDFDWFCPTCTEAIVNGKANATKSGSRISSSKKMKKGKSASQSVVKKGATKAKTKLALKQKKAAYSAQQPRTSTGRFASKGNKSPTSAASTKVKNGSVVKRGPGRPPKHAKKGPMSKFKNPKKSSKNSKKPMFSSSGGMVPSVTQQRSRSGRVVKRKAAYDEREEGAQLMKGVSNSTFEGTDDDSVATKGSSSRGLPSSAAMIAANTAASVIQKQQNTFDKRKTLIHGEGSMRGPRASSPNNLTLQHLHGINVSGEDPHSSSKKFSSSEGIDSGRHHSSTSKNPRRKPGARECMQISRRFGAGIIPHNYMDVLMVCAFLGLFCLLSERLVDRNFLTLCLFANNRTIAQGGKWSI